MAAEDAQKAAEEAVALGDDRLAAFVEKASESQREVEAVLETALVAGAAAELARRGALERAEALETALRERQETLDTALRERQDALDTALRAQQASHADETRR